MKISCCKCEKVYLLEDNIFEYKGANRPLLRCPHCGYKHLLDFIPFDKNLSLKKLEQLKLTTYYIDLTATRLADASRSGGSGADDEDVIGWALANSFIVATQIGTSKGPIARQYKLQWRDYGEVAGTYYADGSDVPATDPDNVWDDETNADDGSITTFAKTDDTGSTTSNYIYIEGTNVPGSGDAVTGMRMRIYGYVIDSGDEVKVKCWLGGGSVEVGQAVCSLVGSPGWGDWATMASAPARILMPGLEFAISATIADSGNSKWAYVYKVEIEVTTGSSGFVDVEATGKIKWAQSGDTVLTDGNSLPESLKRCTGTPEPLWVDGLENEIDNILPDSGTFSLTDECYSEFHWGLNPAAATALHEYEFRLYDVTEGVVIGVCGATVTMAAAGTTVSDTRGARTWGAEIVNDTRDARTKGGLIESDTREARTKGGIQVNDTRGCRTWGASAGTTVSDMRGARTKGGLVDSDIRGARTWGAVIESDTRDARTKGGIVESDIREARTWGAVVDNDTREARTKGGLVENDTREARTKGGEQANDTRGCRTWGISAGTTVSDTRGARTWGAEKADDTRGARTWGAAIESDTREARTKGGVVESDVRDARTKGGLIEADTRGARTWGAEVASDTREARTKGGLVESDTRTARTKGGLVESDIRGARTWGAATVVSERGCRTWGGTLDIVVPSIVIEIPERCWGPVRIIEKKITIQERIWGPIRFID